MLRDSKIFQDFCGSKGADPLRLRSWVGMGVKKTGKGRRKIGRKKRKMRSKIRHRK